MGPKGERICASFPGELLAKGRTAENGVDMCSIGEKICAQRLRKLFVKGSKPERRTFMGAKVRRFVHVHSRKPVSSL